MTTINLVTPLTATASIVVPWWSGGAWDPRLAAPAATVLRFAVRSISGRLFTGTGAYRKIITSVFDQIWLFDENTALQLDTLPPPFDLEVRAVANSPGMKLNRLFPASILPYPDYTPSPIVLATKDAAVVAPALVSLTDQDVWDTGEHLLTISMAAEEPNGNLTVTVIP